MAPFAHRLTDCYLLTGCALLFALACGSTDNDLFDAAGGRAGAGAVSNAGSGGGGGAAAPIGSPSAGGASAGSTSAGGMSSSGVGGEALGGAESDPDGGTGGEPDDEVAVGGEGGSDGSGGNNPLAGSGGKASGGGGVAGTGGKASTAGSGGKAGGGKAGAGSGGSGGAGCLPSTESCDGLDNDCDGVVDEGATCPAACEGLVIAGHGYMFCLAAASTFTNAITRCAAQEMHLVWIESAAENAAIVDAVEASGETIDRAWIGGADRAEEGEWTWVSSLTVAGTPFWSGLSAEAGGVSVLGRYANWGALRPNAGTGSAEDCATITLDRTGLEPGTWNDDVCSGVSPFICEG
ncbi:MAG TPA: C-type lectin domain-containing protein [Polyangiaceae bacterium]|nr:C-type lectin domain-containing protein [Polyangiaceae bacterium]